jgi:hypothetical protein
MINIFVFSLSCFSFVLLMLFNSGCQIKSQTAGGSNSGGIDGSLDCKNNDFAYADGNGIVGGSEVSSDSATDDFTVLIFVDEQAKSSMCSGVLIKGDVVLTAAHCFDKLNSNDLSNVQILTGQPKGCVANKSVKVSGAVNPQQIVIHPKYKGLPLLEDDMSVLKSVYYDLALVKLKNNITDLNANLSFDELNPYDLPRMDTKAIGFGRTEADLGKTDYSKVRLREARVFGLIDENSWTQDLIQNRNSDFYFFDQKSKSGICKGDSGAGLFIHSNNQYYLKGIASIVFKGPGDNSDLNCSRYSAFTKLSMYENWIKNTLLSF